MSSHRTFCIATLAVASVLAIAAARAADSPAPGSEPQSLDKMDPSVPTPLAAHIVASHESDLAQQLSPTEAAELVKAGKATLVDVRTREEFDAVHIEGSTFFTQELMHELGAWDREKLIVFVCHHGIRSQAAAEHFVQLGFERVFNLDGGIDAWSSLVDSSVSRY